MSKYNQYAQKLDKITREGLKRITDAEKAVKEAEKALHPYAGQMRLKPEEQAAKIALESKYREAQNTLRNIRNDVPYKAQIEIDKIRKELDSELQRDYTADPSKCDAATLELLKSGVMKPQEYSNLIQKAKSDGNETMARVIGKYAKDAYQQQEKTYSADEKATMNYAIHEANTSGAQSYLDTFDKLSNVAMRTCNNTALETFYNENASAMVENF